MAIKLRPESRTQLIASIKRYAAEELEVDVGDLKAGALLDYVVREIGPTIYNQAITDAQTYFQERALDLEGACYEKELTYWAEVDAERAKRKARPR